MPQSKPEDRPRARIRPAEKHGEPDATGHDAGLRWRAWVIESPTRHVRFYVWTENEKLVEGKTTRYRRGRTRVRSRDYHTCEKISEIPRRMLRLRLKWMRKRQRKDKKAPLTEQLYTLHREGALTVYTRPHNEIQHDEPNPHDLMRNRRVGPYRDELDPNRIETWESDKGIHHRIKRDWEMELTR